MLIFDIILFAISVLIFCISIKMMRNTHQINESIDKQNKELQNQLNKKSQDLKLIEYEVSNKTEILNNYSKVYNYLNRDKQLLKMLKQKYKEAYSNADKTKWSMGRKLLYGVCYALPRVYSSLKRT